MMHLFGVLGLHAVRTHEGDADTLKKLAAHRIGEVEHCEQVPENQYEDGRECGV